MPTSGERNINVDEIMDQIRSELRRRKNIRGTTYPLTLMINDLFEYDDREFVINAYRVILNREPDAEGFEHFKSNLSAGKMTKAEVLARLRYSPEGRLLKVHIKGLFRKFLANSFYKIPIFAFFSRNRDKNC